jgi:HK97 family phage major capsid protein
MPRITSGAVAGYTGEGQDADETSVGTDRVRLIPKELIGLLPFSNMLLNQSSPGTDTILKNQLDIGISLGEDRAFLRGPAAGAGPTGLRYLAAAANIIASNPASPTAPVIAEVDDELGQLELALIGSDVPMISPYWVMAPRTMIYLMNLRDGNGNKVYPEMSLAQPMLRGKPVKVSTVVPVNLSTDKSEIYLFDASQQMIGENPRISIASSNVASYVNANGDMVSAYSRNETVLRTVLYNDINTQHPESIAVLTDVRWGA